MSERTRYEWSMGAAGPVLTAAEENLAWMDRALCAEVDPELHFPGEDGSAAEAKQVCAGCEVWFECLRYALENNVEHGIWGGLDEAERLELRPAPVVAADDREKVCTGPCGLPRPLSEFRLLEGRRERHRETWCQACRREAHRRVAA